MKNPSPAAPSLPFQPTLCPALPVVLGNVDYQNFAARLRRMDQRLIASGVETSLVEQCLARYDQQCPAATTKARARHQRHSYRALRCNMLRGLLGEDYRGLAGGWPSVRSSAGFAGWRNWPPCACPAKARCRTMPTGCRPKRCARSSNN